MPRRKPPTTRPSLEALRRVIQAGIPWAPREQHYALTRHLSMEQKALLAHLTPFKSAAYFLEQLDPETISAAKRMLADDVKRAAREHIP